MHRLSFAPFLPRFALLVLFLSGGRVLAEVSEDVVGEWTMEDSSPALIDPLNPAGFRIQSVVSSQSQWAQGHFFMRWEKAAQTERGYFRANPERVWVTTYRWIDRKKERVEYRGTIKRDKNGVLVWSGTANTTGRPRQTWAFEARQN